MNQLSLPAVTTAIFDMDGLLLDTEPLWRKSMLKIARQNNIPITEQELRITTGLRIYEVTKFWRNSFVWSEPISTKDLAEAILDEIIDQSKRQQKLVMPGVKTCLEMLRHAGIKIGLATSSPMRMVQELIPCSGLADYFDVLFSADTSGVGKPHPDVFLQCASALNADPLACLVFEDSVNGMIAAKAARMKVVIVPEANQYDKKEFILADAKLHSLADFSASMWKSLSA